MNDDGLWVIYFDNNAARYPRIQRLRLGETLACQLMDGFVVVQGRHDAEEKYAAFHSDYRQYIADEAMRIRHVLPTAPRDAAESC
jgi:hypothetical protein